MSTFFRLSVVATTIVMAATMSAFAGNNSQSSNEGVTVRISPIARFAEEGCVPNKKWYEEDYKNPWKNPCRDSGSDCCDQVVINYFDASVTQVSGGFLVTAKMAPVRVILASGAEAGVYDPTPGQIIEPKQYEFRISDTPISALHNVVVDFSGCVVDNNLNVTKFVAVR